MWHTIKHTNKCIIGIQEVEDEEKGAEKIQIKTKNFWNILKHNNPHIWKALQTVYDKYKNKVKSDDGFTRGHYYRGV